MPYDVPIKSNARTKQSKRAAMGISIGNVDIMGNVMEHPDLYQPSVYDNLINELNEKGYYYNRLAGGIIRGLCICYCDGPLDVIDILKKLSPIPVMTGGHTPHRVVWEYPCKFVFLFSPPLIPGIKNVILINQPRKFFYRFVSTPWNDVSIKLAWVLRRTNDISITVKEINYGTS